MRMRRLRNSVSRGKLRNRRGRRRRGKRRRR